MTQADTDRPSSIFDRSFLPDAQLEFVVLADTHYMHNPHVYKGGPPQDPPYRLALTWSARADHAWRLANSLESAFIVHLGDLTQEFPGRGEDFDKARQEARDQFMGMDPQPYVVVGNMDIGDKQDATVLSGMVTPTTLADWHSQFGRSWYSLDRQDVHFVFVNSQIMDGELPEVEKQREWLESDLAAHHGERIFVFLHVPPFFIEEGEPGIGHYNVLNQTPRRWLLGLLRRHNVEMLFSGHLHFAGFNRIDDTRHYLVPTTTFTRGGFFEVFSVFPPDAGRNDVGKLGFFLVRVQDDGTRVHFVRTRGDTAPAPDAGPARLITRVSRDLPDSPLGVDLRLPLANLSDGPVSYPGAVRHPVRDDYPFLACLELGARHLRAPQSDLVNPLQSQRLGMARDEGLQVTAVRIWSDEPGIEEVPGDGALPIDTLEVQMPGTVWPESDQLETIERWGGEMGVPVTLAPLINERTGEFHRRLRIGYRPGELAELDRSLSEAGKRIDRVLGYVGPDADPWEAIQEFTRLPPLGQVGSVDVLVRLPSFDEKAQIRRASEAVMASPLLGRGRLFIDPLVDMDRGDDSDGLLDRLSNPRPAFHVVRCLNTVLFASSEAFQPVSGGTADSGRILGLVGRTKRLWLLLPDGKMSVGPDALDGLDTGAQAVTLFDLVGGTSQAIPLDGGPFRGAVSGIERPTLVSQEVRSEMRPT